jgi:hypothetical protein
MRNWECGRRKKKNEKLGLRNERAKRMTHRGIWDAAFDELRRDKGGKKGMGDYKWIYLLR